MAQRITDLTAVLNGKRRPERLEVLRSVAIDIKRNFPDTPNADVMRAIYRACFDMHARERLLKDEIWDAIVDAAVAVNGEVAQ